MSTSSLIQAELQAAADVLQRFLSDPQCVATVGDAADLLVSAIRGGGKIISCGNGGSHCDAMHFAEELTGRYRADRPALPAVAISDPSHLSCVANDYGFERVFARYVEGLGRPGDVLLALSTSGNSPNVVAAVAAARQRQMSVVLLTGNDGGLLAGQGDVEIRVPHTGYADRIQEMHIKVIHILIYLIERQLGDEKISQLES